MARLWPTTSMGGRLLSGLAVASLLVAGSAAWGGQQPPPTTAQRKSNPEMGSTVTRAGSAGSAAATAGTPAVDPVSLRRRREAIAHLLEGTLAYRTAIDNGAPKLLETLREDFARLPELLALGPPEQPPSLGDSENPDLSAERHDRGSEAPTPPDPPPSAKEADQLGLF